MGRIRLNEKVDQSNTVDFKTFYNLAQATLDLIIKDIRPLCGQNALQNIVVFRDDNSYLNNVFSNDGIHTLSKTEYINPIQTYVSNYIRYIAERVEKASSDGTSTAIYLSCNLLKYALESVMNVRRRTSDDEIRLINVTMRDTNAIKNELIIFLDYLKSEMAKFKIEFNSLNRRGKAAFIYNLANITSKNNHVLAGCAVELFIDLPERLYKYVSYNQTQGETDTDISIDEIDYDFKLVAIPSANVQYNSKLNTELLYENCDVIVIPTLHHINSKILIEFIDKKYDGTLTPIIVITNGGDDATNNYIERELGVRNIAFCKTMSHIPQFLNNPLELNILQVVAGKRINNPLSIVDFENNLITGVKCVLFGKELKFFELYEHSHGFVHPSYIIKDNPDYDKLASEIEAQIDIYENCHDKVRVREITNEFVRLYTSLICSRLPKLIVGGSTLTHMANINVVVDVLGAVSVALKEGIVIDLIPKLRHITNSYINEEIGDSQSLLDIRSFYGCIRDFYELTYQTIYSFGSADDVDRFSYFDKILDKWIPTSLEDKDNLIVQSFKSFEELIDRLLETIPRIICTDRIIVTNGIMDKEDE